MKSMDLRTNKPCLICGKTPRQSYHVECGIELDRRRKSEMTGFGGVSKQAHENGIKNATSKRYLTGRVPYFARDPQ